MSELSGIIDRPDAFSYAELRAATDAFDKANILGQGGYGPVYKVPIRLFELIYIKNEKFVGMVF